MNLLLVDLGNTRVKWALATAAGKLRLAGEHSTAKISAGWVRSFAAKHASHQLVLASVVPKWNAAFARAFHGRATIVSGRSPALKGIAAKTGKSRSARPALGQRGLPKDTSLRSLNGFFHYPKPAELGADRIAAAVAARADNLVPAIIIACGTATAYTVLDAKGRLCGGAIAPGLQAQLDALVGATAQLPSTTLKVPRSALAKSTRDAINAGVVLSFQGGIKETVARLSATLPRGKKPSLILTGGNAKLAAAALGGKVTLRPLLVLEGLLIIATRL